MSIVFEICFYDLASTVFGFHVWGKLGVLGGLSWGLGVVVVCGLGMTGTLFIPGLLLGLDE